MLDIRGAKGCVLLTRQDRCRKYEEASLQVTVPPSAASPREREGRKLVRTLIPLLVFFPMFIFIGSMVNSYTIV